MSLGKELISKEIGRLKRGVSDAKMSIDNVNDKADVTGYKKTMSLHEASIKELEKDLKKL